jgi:hypothetical protein
LLLRAGRQKPPCPSHFPEAFYTIFSFPAQHSRRRSKTSFLFLITLNFQQGFPLFNKGKIRTIIQLQAPAKPQNGQGAKAL